MIAGLLIALIFGFGLSFVSKIRENQQVIPWILLIDNGDIQLSGSCLRVEKN